MLTLASFVARAAGWLSRRLGRGGGTTLPGVVLLKLRPQAIRELAADLSQGAVLCSATNGKTTTTRLLAAAMSADGSKLVTNAEGSNLERGIAAALLHREPDAMLGVFEVDEAALAAVAAATGPGVIVLMNLFRDQLDRYGELETLVDKWHDVLDAVGEQSKPPTLVLNSDDPNIAALGRGRDNVVWFGLDDLSHEIERLHAIDATTCRQCGAALEHTVLLLGHLGHWHCPNCDATRPAPTISASQVSLRSDGQTVQVQFPTGHEAGAANTEIAVESSLPGLHNSYNIVAACAASYALAVRAGQPHDAEAVAAAIHATTAAFGRGEVIDVDGTDVQLLLAKNPTGVNQNVRTVLADNERLHVLVLLNDRTADGQDVSWIWDVDWERLDGRVASVTLGGDRAWDLALRFRYGGFDMDNVTVVPEIDNALDTALAAAGSAAGADQRPMLRALPTYTAMLEMRAVLADRGYTSPYWNDV